MKQLNWNKCSDDQWCDFFNLNLDHEHFENLKGVYIIWHCKSGDQKARVVRVGQGIIKDRIAAHREDPEITAFKNYGMLATWVSVSDSEIDGVERYLFDYWKPLVGQRAPDVTAIPVSSPWKS